MSHSARRFGFCLRLGVIAAAALAACRIASAAALDVPVQGAERLSHWLQAHPELVAARYPLGLMWLVESEKPLQAQAQADVLRRLAEPPDSPKSPERARLIQLVQAMPVTGRVLTDAAVGDWLDVNPRRDPALQPGDVLRWPARPTSVAVLGADARWCRVAHHPDASVVDVLAACQPPESSLPASAPDWAWVIQPDGRVQRVGVAAWNFSPPLALAPGAMVWVPAVDHAADDMADDAALAHWLARQGPAADVGGVAGDAPVQPLKADAATLRHHNQALTRAAHNAPTPGDWGFVGLLQTPTARMQPAGTFTFGMQRTLPYTRTNLFFQPLDDLEFGFRYVDIANRVYALGSLDTTQSYKDKSIDLKLRLSREDAWWPEVSTGLLDLGGTGMFGGEYLVGNKRWGGVDLSLGLGWGYLGQRHDARNPLGLLSSSLDNRPADDASTVGQGGVPAFRRFYRGRVGVFGGLQFQPTAWPLLVKLEVEGNDYRHEPLGNHITQKTPVNFGLVYQPNSSVDLNLGWQRGNRFAFGVTFKMPLASMQTTKLLDPKPVTVEAERPRQAPDWQRTAADLAAQTGWPPAAIKADAQRVQVDFDAPQAVYPRERIDRALAVLHRDAPASVDQLQLRLGSPGGGRAFSAEVGRNEWVRSQTEPPRSQQAVNPVRIVRDEDATSATAAAPPETLRLSTPALRVEPAFDLLQTIGGPNAFVLYQLSAALHGTLRLPAGWALAGDARLRVLDNYGNYSYDGPSQLPRVRTYLREYQTSRRATLESLALSQVSTLGANQYGAVYAGLFESMYGGVGGEWLYRRSGAPWAFGIDLNRVQQRDFRQNLDFRAYRVSTGHATWYWDTGWQGVASQVSAGQYLAGDRGVTVTLKKHFSNGTAMSVFATKTNVSTAQFGEGSFDKGIALTIPFDVLLPRSSTTWGYFLWKPLTRDGGAMVSRPVELFDATDLLSPRALERRSAPPADAFVAPDDRQDAARPGSPAGR